MNNKKITDYSTNEPVINVELYEEIVSVLFNSLKNVIVRKEIIKNSNILEKIKLQVANMLYLESLLKTELANKRWSIQFLQLISDIVNQELKVSKSNLKTALQILEEKNFLIVTIINTCKVIERETLEEKIKVDEDVFNHLKKQILALNDFATNKNSNVVVNDQQTTPTKEGSNTVPFTTLGFGINSNLTKNLNHFNNLPQHPISNPQFYPYLTKPKLIPLLKKILAAFLAFAVLMIVSMWIISYTIDTLIIEENLNKVFKGSMIISEIHIIFFLSYFIYSIYILVQEPKLKREKYHVNPIFISMLAAFSIFVVFMFWNLLNDKTIKTIIKELFPKSDNIIVFNKIKSLYSFNILVIFSYITSVCMLFVFALALMIIFINPKLNKPKIIKANVEYQNAVNASIQGQKYEIDPSLFDDQESTKKTKNHFKKGF